MVYGYIRVSTDAQNTANQKAEIEHFCLQNNLKIDTFIEDVISGTKDPKNRKLGTEIMNNCQQNDLVICTELSRLGRNLLMIMNTLNYFQEHGVKVWTIKDNFRLTDDITSKVVSFAFGLAAEIERQLISQRTKAALERIKKEGKHIGRYKGRKSSSYKLTEFEPYIIFAYRLGIPKSKIARRLGVTWDTVDAQLKRISIQ